MNNYLSNKLHLLLWLLAFVPVVFSTSGCKDDIDPYEKPSVTVSPMPEDGQFLFEKEAGEKILTLKTNRKWSIELTEKVDWLSITPTSGEEGEHQIKIAVLKNNGEAREAQMLITASNKRFVFNIQQKSVEGQAIEYTSISEILEEGNKLDSEQGSKTIDTDIRIRAVVTTDSKAGQFAFAGYHHIEDKSGAMVLTVPKGEDPIEFGCEITARLKGCQLTNYRGTIQIQVPRAQMVIEKDRAIEPKVLEIKEILSGKYPNQYVRVEGVEFQKYQNEKFFDGSYSSKRHNIINKVGDILTLEVWKHASFKDEMVPEGSGYIIGVVTVNKSKSGQVFNNLRPINRESIVLSDARFDVTGEEPTEDLSISPSPVNNMITLPAEENTKDFTIKSSLAWKASIDNNWLTITPSEGTEGTTNIKLHATANTGEERTAKLTLSSSSKTLEITIKQSEKSGGVETLFDGGISAIKQLPVDQVISGQQKIRGVVISGNRNFSGNKNMVICDDKAGIFIRINGGTTDAFPEGTEVEVDPNGFTLTRHNNGSLQISEVTADKIVALETTHTIAPIEVSFTDLMTQRIEEELDCRLVKVDGVQTKYTTFKDNRTPYIFFDSTSKYSTTKHAITDTYTTTAPDGYYFPDLLASKYSPWKEKEMPTGNGYIIGVILREWNKKFNNFSAQLWIRNWDTDLKLDGPRK